MSRLLAALLTVGLCSFSFCLQAAEPVDKPDTLMSVAGKLIFSDNFDKPLAKPWRKLKGRWDIVDGVIQGAELAADKHGAVMRMPTPVHNVVVQYEFMLQGTKMTSFSFNDAKGHCCRVLINSKGIVARKDMHKKIAGNKPVTLQKTNVKIANGQWHKLVIEIQGSEMLVRLDGKQTAYGSHAEIDVDKNNLGLTVSGASASFKNLRIWEATPKKEWPANKAKLVK